MVVVGLIFLRIFIPVHLVCATVLHSGWDVEL